MDTLAFSLPCRVTGESWERSQDLVGGTKSDGCNMSNTQATSKSIDLNDISITTDITIRPSFFILLLVCVCNTQRGASPKEKGKVECREDLCEGGRLAGEDDLILGCKVNLKKP